MMGTVKDGNLSNLPFVHTDNSYLTENIALIIPTFGRKTQQLVTVIKTTQTL